jgi:hypothetical protein
MSNDDRSKKSLVRDFESGHLRDKILSPRNKYGTFRL